MPFWRVDRPKRMGFPIVQTDSLPRRSQRSALWLHVRVDSRVLILRAPAFFLPAVRLHLSKRGSACESESLRSFVRLRQETPGLFPIALRNPWLQKPCWRVQNWRFSSCHGLRRRSYSFIVQETCQRKRGGVRKLLSLGNRSSVPGISRETQSISS